MGMERVKVRAALMSDGPVGISIATPSEINFIELRYDPCFISIGSPCNKNDLVRLVKAFAA
jgi:hypothetical protein